jgi:hypothetical protein
MSKVISKPQTAKANARQNLKRPHGYLKPLKESYGYCKRCARRSTPCLKCGYCYVCHPFKEMDEEAELLYQTAISAFA